MGEPRYAMLMTSLPYHGRLFGARQTPLSRFQLDKRLAWLDRDDAETLERIEDVLQWRRQLMAETDANFLQRAEGVVSSLDNPLLEKIVRARLESRTLVAALRMRVHGDSAPSAGQRWGFGRWVPHVRRHWTEPDFGLSRQFPWVVEADERMHKRDALGLERLLLDDSWRMLAQFGAGHYFDFEAVAVYVLRWDLIDRWTHYDSDAAKSRVLELAEAGLGSYRRIFH